MLRYHQAACQLLGVAATVDDADLAAVDARERKLGRKLPAAVAEWYALPLAQQRVSEGSSDWHHQLNELGKPGWGAGIHDFLAEGLLLIGAENQGVCHWAIPVDEGDDPRVLVEVDGEPDELEWHTYAWSFTEYVFTIAWDTWAFAMPHALAAQELSFGEADRALLENHFTQRPKTYEWPGAVNYRYERPGHAVMVWDAPAPHRNEQTDWWLFADTAASLRDLVTGLWQCGDLANTLYPLTGSAAEVLAELR